MNEINIHTISNLQRYVRSYGLPKLPICGLDQIYEHGLVALPGKPTPSIKDHRKSKNPYFSRYGDRWVEKLKQSYSMLEFFCITDLIRFMMKEAENLIKGSVHEDEFFIIHDALQLIYRKGDDQMDEIEELLPQLVAAHEWIAGWDTLCWVPCR